MDIQEFSEFEKIVINEIIALDAKRRGWENYIGIPVLSFISVFFRTRGLFPSLDEENIIFAFSLRSKNKEQKEIIDNQRMVIFALHLLEKLKQKGYIVCLILDSDSFEMSKKTLPIYGLSSELKELKIKFSLDELQGIGKDLIYQAIVVTEDLKQISKQGFKTIEQIRYENEMDKMLVQINKSDAQIIKADSQVKWAQKSFGVAIAALIVSLISLGLSFSVIRTSNDNITTKDLYEIINNRKMPDIINANLTNDTVKAIIISRPQNNLSKPVKNNFPPK